MILKLQVVGPDGGNPTYEQSFRRNIFVAANLITWIPVLGIVVSLAVLVGVILIAVNISSDPGQPAGLARPLRRRHPRAQARLTQLGQEHRRGRSRRPPR